MTGTLPISKLRTRLSKALGQLRGNDQWIIVTRYGEAAAALVSLNLLRRALDADRPEDLLEAKSAIRTLEDTALTDTDIGEEETDERPDAEELLERIARNRRSFGLPPLRR